MILAQDDFAKFAPGPYPSEYSPLPEMYCFWPYGETHGWHEPVTGHGWKKGHWTFEEENGGIALVQTVERPGDSLNSILVKGDDEWEEVTVKADLSFGEDPIMVGLLFRYQNALDYYAAVFKEKRLVVIRKDIVRMEELASCPYEKDGERVELAVRCKGSNFTILLDGKEQLSVTDAVFTHGKAGIIAATGARFYSYTVEADAQEAERVENLQKQKLTIVAQKKQKYPQMELWKEIPLGDFVGGKSFRYGDLTGNGVYDILVAQRSKVAKAEGKGSPKQGISCLTAVDLDGNILWQRGTPSEEYDWSTGDMAMQICDFDGTGNNNVICVMDGQFQLLEGATGNTIRTGELPDAPPPNEQAQHIGGGWFAQCVNGQTGKLAPNGIRVANLTGREKGLDFLCTSGYPYVWGFGNNMEQMWFHTGNIGHFQTTYDVDGDGKDEVLAGYNFLRGDGTWQWSLHLQDHADAVLIMPHDHPKGGLKFIAAGGEDGLLFFDDKGWFRQILKGHVQHISIGKYRPDVAGLQIAVVTYHGNPGLVTLYDRDGVELACRETPCCGTNLQPVNWTGDGQELILFSGQRDIGGLMDADLDVVVEFPTRDRPELWCESIRFQGDARDEILVFDRERMHIYKTCDAFSGKRIYAPERAPLCNWSNFMAHYSYPAWQKLG